MTTNTDIKSLFDVFFAKVDLPKEELEYFKKMISETADDEFLNHIVKFVKDNLKEIELFHKTLSFADKALSSKMLSGANWDLSDPTNPKETGTNSPLPIMLLGSTPDTIKVYPNLTLSNNNIEELKNIDIILFNCFFADWYKTYKADKLDDTKKQKYEPLDRALKWAFTFEEVSTSRALARFVPMFKETPDNAGKLGTRIRDFAANIDAARKPMEICFAETPEAFLDMYLDGPGSCMSAKTAGEAMNWKMLTDHGWSPTSFYAFVPGVKGVYAKKGKTVLARVVCFEDTKTPGKWYHGRIYSNPEVAEKFNLALQQHNITPLSGYYEPKVPKEGFRIPGLAYGGQHVAPYPYMDNMNAASFNVAFDNASKEFIVTYRGSGVPAVRRSGHIRSIDYVVLMCDHCKVKIQNGAAITTEDGKGTFCSENHAFAEGYIRVIQGNGNNIYMKGDEVDETTISTLGTSLIRFSTVKAGMDNGYYPLMKEPGIFPEETDILLARKDSIVNDQKGNTYTFYNSLGLSIKVVGSVVPIGAVKEQKNVEWDDMESLVQYKVA